MKVTICDRCGNVAKGERKVVVNNFLEKKEMKEENKILYVTGQFVDHYNGTAVQTKDLCQSCYNKYKVLINDFFKELSE